MRRDPDPAHDSPPLGTFLAFRQLFGEVVWLSRPYPFSSGFAAQPPGPQGRPVAIRRARSGYFVVVTFGPRLLTAHPPQDYITPLRRASVFGRDVAPAKHLTDIR